MRKGAKHRVGGAVREREREREEGSEREREREREKREGRFIQERW